MKKADLQEQINYISHIKKKYSGKKDIFSEDMDVIREQIDDLKRLKSYGNLLNELSNIVNSYEQLKDTLKKGVEKNIRSLKGKIASIESEIDAPLNEKLPKINSCSNEDGMTPAEIAKKYEVCIGTVYYKINNGLIKKAGKRGNKDVYDASDNAFSKKKLKKTG